MWRMIWWAWLAMVREAVTCLELSIEQVQGQGISQQAVHRYRYSPLSDRGDVWCQT